VAPSRARGSQVGATVSALLAPRAPSGFSAPVVVSRFVWCSISAFSSAPMSTMVAEDPHQRHEAEGSTEREP
jgi:hypothetical protein